MFVLMKKVALISPLFNIGGIMIEEKVRNLIEDSLKERDILIDTIKYEKEGNNNFLRIVVDRNKSIDVDAIVEITKVINPLLDEADVISDSYILDISSKEKGELK